MKKPAFQRCLKSVPTLTSAQRGEVKIAIEQVDHKNRWGLSHLCSEPLPVAPIATIPIFGRGAGMSGRSPD